MFIVNFRECNLVNYYASANILAQFSVFVVLLRFSSIAILHFAECFPCTHTWMAYPRDTQNLNILFVKLCDFCGLNANGYGFLDVCNCNNGETRTPNIQNSSLKLYAVLTYTISIKYHCPSLWPKFVPSLNYFIKVPRKRQRQRQRHIEHRASEAKQHTKKQLKIFILFSNVI